MAVPNPSDDQTTSKASWADEVNSPSTNNPPPNKLESSTAEMSQLDGATEPFMGSQLQEPDYAVEIKLADLQADPNNPLFSVKSFDELGLCVFINVVGTEC